MSDAPIGGTEATGKVKAPGKKRGPIYIGIAGLVVVYLLYRRMKASAAAGATSASAIPSTYSNNTAGNAADTSGLAATDIGTIENQLSGFATDIAGLQGTQATDEANATAAAAQQTATNASNTSLLGTITSTLGSIGQSLASVGSQTQAVAAGSSGVVDQSAAPSLSAGLVNQLQSNGEAITRTVKSTAGGWLYLTNKGGVYTADGAPSFGSYLGYAATTKDPKAEIAGNGDFSNGNLIALANGHYTEVNSKGESYTF